MTAFAARSAVSKRSGAEIAPAQAKKEPVLGLQSRAEPGNQQMARRLGNGQPLPPRVRTGFQGLLGAELGAVRIHQDASAAATASSLRAQAFTIGNDVVFGAGRYRPQTPQGLWLLAHELAHVAQARNPSPPSADGAVERDADAAATELVLGRSPRLTASRDPRRMHLFGEPQHVPDITYIAGQDPRNDGFLQDATAYHNAWQLRPRLVNSLEDIVDHLAGGQGNVGRIRVITHASQTNLFTAFFRGGSPGILENELRAFSESDAAGLEALYGTGLLTAQTYTNLLDQVRADDPAVLRPFGLDAAGAAPTGAVQRLIRRSADLLMHTVGTVDPGLSQPEQATVGRQRGTIQTALRTMLAGIRQEVQQQPPAGAGVTAQQAQDLQDAITGIQNFNFTLGVQPADFVAGLSNANAAINRGFRGHLNTVRGRFDSSSWVDIRGCRVGGSQSYLEAVAGFFGTGNDKPHVSGPDWWQSFPTVGYQTVLDRDIGTTAADADVRTALDHWFPLTGVESYMRRQIIYFLDLLIEEQRQQAAPHLRFGGPRLLGGLVPAVDLGLPLLLLPRVGDLQLQPPSLLQQRQPGNIGLGLPQMRNPLYSLAESEVARIQAELTRIENFTTEEKLRYYFDMALVLPVQAAADPEDIRLYMKHTLRNQAMDNWLGSIWASRAPGLAALQRGAWNAGDARRVEAVVDQDPQRNVTEMYISPDTRYAEHIRSV